MTNATKANLIALLNALLGLLIAFGVNLSDAQMAGILVFANAAAATFVGLTFENSQKRLPEPVLEAGITKDEVEAEMTP